MGRGYHGRAPKAKADLSLPRCLNDHWEELRLAWLDLPHLRMRCARQGARSELGGREEPQLV